MECSSSSAMLVRRPPSVTRSGWRWRACITAGRTTPVSSPSTRMSFSRTSGCRSSTSSSVTSRSRTLRRGRTWRATCSPSTARSTTTSSCAQQLIDEFGAEFSTQGDAEVVVAGYHYWGEAVLDKLRGMFAFLIWDSDERKAFGARDPFGIKPLHYLRTPDGHLLRQREEGAAAVRAVRGQGRRRTQHRQPLALPDPAVRAGAGHPALRHQPDRVGRVPYLHRQVPR